MLVYIFNSSQFVPGEINQCPKGSRADDYKRQGILGIDGACMNKLNICLNSSLCYIYTVGLVNINIK